MVGVPTQRGEIIENNTEEGGREGKEEGRKKETGGREEGEQQVGEERRFSEKVNYKGGRL